MTIPYHVELTKKLCQGRDVQFIEIQYGVISGAIIPTY